ncbi:MAG: hypothetical protein A2Y15_02010 [Clostridiales bacterium GWF2_36_10]|nr:MAG: hypothetical protein A2Y15_02010 [Clostridiales bacterium GWF2_36_10]HAN20810.1 hypothetical protein [Clostridiales bacterium]
MLYPSLQDLTTEKVNRYKLVIATAKCARHVTQKANEQKEAADQKKELDRFSKDSKNEMTADAANDKAVSVAIKRIYNGDYKIITE